MQLSISTLLGSLLLSSFFVGCGSSSSSNTDDSSNNNSDRFKSVTMMNQIVMQDKTTSLEWVNGSGGCHPMTPGKTQAVALAESLKHCDDLVYAGHSDWRVPTPNEIKEFNVEMGEAGITPFYANPSCPRVVGLNDRATDLSTVSTHNTPPIGTVAAWMNSNAGVRCVRGI